MMSQYIVTLLEVKGCLRCSEVHPQELVFAALCTTLLAGQDGSFGSIYLSKVVSKNSRALHINCPLMFG